MEFYLISSDEDVHSIYYILFVCRSSLQYLHEQANLTRAKADLENLKEGRLAYASTRLLV